MKVVHFFSHGMAFRYCYLSYQPSFSTIWRPNDQYAHLKNLKEWLIKIEPIDLATPKKFHQRKNSQFKVFPFLAQFHRQIGQFFIRTPVELLSCIFHKPIRVFVQWKETHMETTRRDSLCFTLWQTLNFVQKYHFSSNATKL